MPLPKPQSHSVSPVSALALAVFCVLVPLVAFFCYQQNLLPAAASDHGTGIDFMLWYLFVTVGSLLLVGHFVLAFFVWRFSRQGRVTSRLLAPKTEIKWAVALLVAMAVVTEGGVMLIGVPIWKKLYNPVTSSETISIEVTAQQFFWYFRYPGADGQLGKLNVNLISDDNPLGLDPEDKNGLDDVVSPGVLYLPEKKQARLLLRSKDVIHSLFIPALRVRQDIVPGMLIESTFLPTQSGRFEILCTELCGIGHFAMRGSLQVLPPHEFTQWLQSQTSPAP